MQRRFYHGSNDGAYFSSRRCLIKSVSGPGIIDGESRKRYTFGACGYTERNHGCDC